MKSLQENCGMKGEEPLDIKTLREARGLTIGDVHQAIKISVSNLEAIEKGDFKRLPPPVYTRAYLVAYAKLLNADEKQVACSYDKYLTALERDGREEAADFSAKGWFFSKKLFAFSLAAFLFLVFFFYLYPDFQSSDAPVIHPLPLKTQGGALETIANGPEAARPETIGGAVEPVTGAETKTAAPEVAVPAAASTVDKGAESKEQRGETTAVSNRLVIRAHEKTWLRINEDNKKIYQLLMMPGEHMSSSAPRFTIDIGNAGGVTIEFQGKTMERLGRSGEVVHLSLP